LTAWHVTVQAGVLVAFGLGVYLLMSSALHSRIDEGLHELIAITATSLRHDAAEGQSLEDAAESTVAELSGPTQPLAIFDAAGRLLASEAWSGGAPPPLRGAASDDETQVTTVHGEDGADVRIAVRALAIPGTDRRYVVMAGESLAIITAELDSLRRIIAWAVPVTLVLTGIGGWLLARKSLAPVMDMAARAERLGAEDLHGRLPVANPRDELGRLAQTFNGLIGRLATAFSQQRQFMADASHELRTPIATARTAASVTLQQPHRDETEYREALEIIEDQTRRLTRHVDDMLTLARADAGEYPVRKTTVDLDEVIDDVARASRVLSAARQVRIDVDAPADAACIADEELLRRLVRNLVDNAIRHARPGGVVRITLTSEASAYALSVEDDGEGIPPEAQRHVFERFYRADTARRRDPQHRGAGLGLAIAKWIAEAHDGRLELVRSTPDGTTFRALLPVVHLLFMVACYRGI
jgi:heavy metal sensor kinase